MDATDLFDRYEEDYEDMPGGGFPRIEINKMHISQSIEVGATLLSHALRRVHCDVMLVASHSECSLSFLRNIYDGCY